MASMFLATRRLVFCAFSAACIAASPGAQAQAGSNNNRVITVTAERLVDATTYSGNGSTNFVAFRVTVANEGGNVVNHVALAARSRVLPSTASDTDSTQWPASTIAAPLDSTTSSACTPGTGGDAVACDIGQLRAAGQAGSSASFVFFFVGPTRTADPGFAEKINLAWTVTYADSSGGQQPDSGSGVANAPTAITPYRGVADEFKSAVPRRGAALSTGSVKGDGLPQPQDPWTARIVVPGGVAGDSATRGTERSDGILESSDLLDRRIAEVVIPNTNYAPNKLVITLRRDVSTIRKGAKIANSKLYYTKTIEGDPSTVTDRAEVPFCNTLPGNGPYLDAAGTWRPCIRSRVSVPIKKVVTGNSQGYWEWVIEAFENGRYIN